MKTLVSSFLVVLMVALCGAQEVRPVIRAPLTVQEMSAVAGGGFWGGALCGGAVAGTLLGTAAAVTAATAGVGAVWGIAIGTSLALHVVSICLLM